MTVVRISETYDLSTQTNKMGFVAIHTPSMAAIMRQWSGLAANHKYVKLLGCDVAMACASMLPADPLQVGLEAGDIAPQDMFNPILYKAVSNDSFNNLLAMMKNTGLVPDVIDPNTVLSGLDNGGSISANNSIDFEEDSTTEEDPVYADQFEMYYGLLANSDGWRKAMPQAGLQMTGLFPIVFGIETTATPFGWQYNGNVVGTLGTEAVLDEKFAVDRGNYNMIRGDAKRMGAIPTYVFSNSGTPTEVQPTWVKQLSINAGTGDNMNTSAVPNKIPRSYVGAIIMPPAKLNKLYYRMKVTWTVEFSGVRSTADLMTWSGLAGLGRASYGTDYDEQSKVMETKTELVDATGAGVTKVMESNK